MAAADEYVGGELTRRCNEGDRLFISELIRVDDVEGGGTGGGGR